jgi:hypothetical protein
MKYLFIFLPFFAMAQDSTLYISTSSTGFRYVVTPEDRSISRNDSLYRFAKSRWTPCNQHFSEVDHPKRDKIEQSEVRLLVWTGCALAECKATKILHYNEMQVAANTGGLAIYRTETIRIDVVVEYKAKDKWIRNSHVIKEL